jgi:DNA polymerase III sliding clamp (beta) subunit (PCNA family)
MKLEVNRLTMLEAAKSVGKIVPSLSPTPMLRNILLESSDDTGEIYMTATNHEVSIQYKVAASVEERGSMLIKPRLLVGMLSLLDGDFVTLSSDSPELLKVICGRCTFHIKCQSAKSYPKPIMPFPEESVIMTGIRSLAKRTTFIVSKDENKPALQCVNVKLKNNAVHAEASDGVGMMLVKDSSGPTDAREFMLPGRSLQALASISDDSDVFEVAEIGNTIVFVRGDMIFTIRKIASGSFMDTTAVIKNFKAVYTATADVGKIKEALNFLSTTALAVVKIESKEPSESKKTKTLREPISLAIANGEILLQCTTEFSEASAEVSATISKDTPESGFFYDISALLKLFQVVSGRVKLEIDENGFMLVKTRNEVYFQSPLRPVVKKAKSSKKATEKDRAKGAKDVKKEVA